MSKLSLVGNFVKAGVTAYAGIASGVFGGRKMQDLETGMQGMNAFASGEPNKAFSLSERIAKIVTKVGEYAQQMPFAPKREDMAPAGP